MLTFADHLILGNDLARLELRDKLVDRMLSDKIGNHEEFLQRSRISTTHFDGDSVGMRKSKFEKAKDSPLLLTHKS